MHTSPWAWPKYFTPGLVCSVYFKKRRCRSRTYLVPLLTARYGASERLLVASVHAHRTEDGLGTDGALCSPRLVAVGLLKVDVLLVTLAA